MSENMKRKLTSRKFWLAVACFITGLIMAFGGGEETAQTVAGCIMSGASVIAYVVGEGLVDRASGQCGVCYDDITCGSQITITPKGYYDDIGGDNTDDPDCDK